MHVKGLRLAPSGTANGRWYVWFDPCRAEYAALGTPLSIVHLQPTLFRPGHHRDIKPNKNQ